MKKVKFKNQTFFWTLVVIIGVYLSCFSIPRFYTLANVMLNGTIIQGNYGFWNSFNIATSTTLTFQYVIIEVFLLILIFTKHRYTKKVIKIWAALFLIIIPFFGFFSYLYYFLVYNVDLNVIIWGVLQLGITILIGIGIFHYTNKTVIIEDVEK